MSFPTHRYNRSAVGPAGPREDQFPSVGGWHPIVGEGQSISDGATTRISAAHKTDVIAEHVELISKGQRHFHFVDLGLDVLKLLEHLFPLPGCGFQKHATFERYQFPVAPVDS